MLANEDASPKGIKLSCDVHADADCGDEPTGLAFTTPDNAESSLAPLSGWEDDNSPVPVSPAISVHCIACSYIWRFAHYVCPFAPLYAAKLYLLAMLCVELVKTDLVQHTSWQAQNGPLQCTSLQLLVVRSGRWLYKEHVQVDGAAIR